MKAIKFGVCGIGRIGREHCQRFSQVDGRYELVAVCDVDQQRAEAAAEQYGGRAYTDFPAFLADPQMELVIIATPSLDHAKNAAVALAAGKVVLLEKPIGVTASDYELLKQLVHKYPGKLYFCHNHRFEPAFMNTQAIIESGLLGKIQVVKLCKHHEFIRRMDWQMRLDCGGGQLNVWGPHLIDQGLQLLGSPAREVHSYLRSILTPGDGDDHVKITLIGEGDTVVEVEITHVAAMASQYCTVYGDRGTLTYGQDQKKIQLKYLDPKFEWSPAVSNAGTPARGTGHTNDPALPWVEEVRDVEPATNMWEQVEIEIACRLYNAICDVTPFPVTSFDALEVFRITQLVKKQNPQFKWVG